MSRRVAANDDLKRVRLCGK